jgi:GrpB-like predicted nucleotidyltransferase (UPF0157 family)
MELDKNLKRKYTIPEWNNVFQEYKKEIEEIFGDTILEIHHIGSTSIPGMAAKPLIDILILVSDIDDLDTETKKMAEHGYFWGRDYIEKDTLIFFKTEDSDQASEKIVNIHVCEPENAKAAQFLVMKEYMLAHPDKVQEYVQLKRELNKQYPEDYPSYRKGKFDFLQNMEQDAYKWKQNLENS